MELFARCMMWVLASQLMVMVVAMVANPDTFGMRLARVVGAASILLLLTVGWQAGARFVP
jgi:hypothetical protein